MRCDFFKLVFAVVLALGIHDLAKAITRLIFALLA